MLTPCSHEGALASALENVRVENVLLTPTPCRRDLLQWPCGGSDKLMGRHDRCLYLLMCITSFRNSIESATWLAFALPS
jgi:hypothetical protein